MIRGSDTSNGEPLNATRDPALAAIFLLATLRHRKGMMRRGERRRLQANLAREVPVLLREPEEQRELLSQLKESIECGDELVKYAERIEELLPRRYFPVVEVVPA